MARAKRNRSAKKSGISEHARHNNTIQVEMAGIAQCWCQGFNTEMGDPQFELRVCQYNV